MNNIKLNKYRDGGTVKLDIYDGDTYYIDNRIGSETKGRMFSRYPSEPSAQQLPIEKELEVYDRIIPLISDDLRVMANQLNTLINNKRKLKEK